MHDNTPLGEMIPFTINRFRDNTLSGEDTHVAAEVPLTFEVNDREIATLMCTPTHLEAFACGFLFTSGFIKSADDISSFSLEDTRWRADIQFKDPVDPDLLGQRVYTSGCGKGVMYTTMMELSSRHPVQSDVQIHGADIIEVIRWLQHCSDLHRITGGVELIKWCGEWLASYKVPGYVEFRDMLPKSKVGKLLRREVRDSEVRKITEKTAG